MENGNAQFAPISGLVYCSSPLDTISSQIKGKNTKTKRMFLLSKQNGKARSLDHSLWAQFKGFYTGQMKNKVRSG